MISIFLLSLLQSLGSLRLHPCLRRVRVQPRLFLSRASRSHVKKGFYFSLFRARRRCETLQERGKRNIVYILIFDVILEGIWSRKGVKIELKVMQNLWKMCLDADFVWECVFHMICWWFSLFFMTSLLEKSDESYVFSRSDCLSHFLSPVLFDISFCIEFS